MEHAKTTIEFHVLEDCLESIQNARKENGFIVGQPPWNDLVDCKDTITMNQLSGAWSWAGSCGDLADFIGLRYRLTRSEAVEYIERHQIVTENKRHFSEVLGEQFYVEGDAAVFYKSGVRYDAVELAACKRLSIEQRKTVHAIKALLARPELDSGLRIILERSAAALMPTGTPRVTKNESRNLKPQVRPAEEGRTAPALSGAAA